MKPRFIPLLIGIGSLAFFYQNCSTQKFDTGSEGSSSPASSSNGLGTGNPSPSPTPVVPLPPFECHDLPPETKPEIRWDWNSQLGANDQPEFNQIMASPVVGDLNGDHHPKVVVVSWTMNAASHFNKDSNVSAYGKNGALRIIEGSTGRNLATVSAAALAPYATTTPLLIDLDNDGKLEIIYVHYTGTKIIALNSNGTLRWSWNLPSGSLAGCVQGLSAADIDKNGKAEVIVGNWLIEENASKAPVIKKILEATPNPLSCNVFATVLDPSKPNFSIVDPYAVHSSSGVKVFSLGTDYGYMAVGKVRSDVAGNQIIKTGYGRLRIFDGITGTGLVDVNLKSYSAYTCGNDASGSPIIGGGPASIGDFIGNGTNQIAIASGQYLMIFDGKGKLLASSRTQDCSSLVTGVTAFDFDGDGKPEILYADEEYMRIFHYENGALKVISKIVNPSGTLFEYPVVADLVGNGSSQLLLVSNNYPASNTRFYADAGEAGDRAAALQTTGIRAFSPHGTSRWMPTRPIWNQYHYNASLVSDAGRVLDPSVAASSWLGKTFKLNAALGLTQQPPSCK